MWGYGFGFGAALIVSGKCCVTVYKIVTADGVIAVLGFRQQNDSSGSETKSLSSVLCHLCSRGRKWIGMQGGKLGAT